MDYTTPSRSSGSKTDKPSKMTDDLDDLLAESELRMTAEDFEAASARIRDLDVEVPREFSAPPQTPSTRGKARLHDQSGKISLSMNNKPITGVPATQPKRRRRKEAELLLGDPLPPINQKGPAAEDKEIEQAAPVVDPKATESGDKMEGVVSSDEQPGPDIPAKPILEQQGQWDEDIDDTATHPGQSNTGSSLPAGYGPGQFAHSMVSSHAEDLRAEMTAMEARLTGEMAEMRESLTAFQTFIKQELRNAHIQSATASSASGAPTIPGSPAMQPPPHPAPPRPAFNLQDMLARSKASQRGKW